MSTKTKEPFAFPSKDIPLWMIGKQQLFDTLLFASYAHRYQRRKYTEEPYIYHPVAVASRLQFFYKNEYGVDAPMVMLQAALLHDTVEDTETTFGDIEKHFGFDVAALVYWVTDLPMPGTNRETRKRLSAERLAYAPTPALILKHFDMDDNTESIEKYDPKFAKVYLAEKAWVRKYTEAALEDAGIYQPLGYRAVTEPLK